MESAIFEEKKVRIFPCDEPTAPTVYSNDFEDEVDALFSVCEEIGCPKFHLVSITNLRWDEELSPWPADSLVSKQDHFTGEADAYLKLLENQIVPYVKAQLPESGQSILNGYSMGGLFALYAVHHTDVFDAYAAPSGSVWYPDFVEYVKNTPLRKRPSAIYLSLGDRESRTKHPYLSQTGTNMELLRDIYQEQGIKTIFELNQGNHFKDVPLREAKGIKWALESKE